MRKLDMEAVILSPAAVSAWHEMAKKFTQAAELLRIRPEEISDEEIWLKDDGETLVIKCRAGRISVDMDVPAGEWHWNAQRN